MSEAAREEDMGFRQKPVERDVVVFLGAGFSAGLGVPTMREFRKESDRQLGTLEREAERQNAGPLLQAAGRAYTEFHDYCDSAGDRIGVDAENLETVFCIAEAMREARAGTQEPLPSALEAAADGEAGGATYWLGMDSLVTRIQLWLWNVYRSFPPLNHKPEISQEPKKAEPCFEAFINALNTRELRRRTTVITTNYDLSVEYYAWKSGNECKYPLTEEWDYVTLSAGPPRPGREPQPYVRTSWHGAPYVEDTYLQVSKLHGSVNFFHLAPREENRVGICADLAKDCLIGRSRVQSERPAIFARDAISELHLRYGESLVPAIIPPTYAKLHGYPWLRRMWNYAFEALRGARLVVFIGYSMPPSDGFMRAMIQGALVARRDSGPDVYVVNPFRGTEGELHEKSYQDLFPILREEPKRMIKATFVEAWQAGHLATILDSVVAAGNGPQ